MGKFLYYLSEEYKYENTNIVSALRGTYNVSNERK